MRMNKDNYNNTLYLQDYRDILIRVPRYVSTTVFGGALWN
jgi:hypothetical protein